MSGSNEELARLREELRREREGRRQDREELRREREERRREQEEMRREQAARIAVEHQLREEREDAARVQGAFRREREEHQRIVQGVSLPRQAISIWLPNLFFVQTRHSTNILLSTSTLLRQIFRVSFLSLSPKNPTLQKQRAIRQGGLTLLASTTHAGFAYGLNSKRFIEKPGLGSSLHLPGRGCFPLAVKSKVLGRVSWNRIYHCRF